MEQKEEENSLFYGSFSDQVLEVLRQFEQGQIEAAETSSGMHKLSAICKWLSQRTSSLT
jgi:hypothetical protein